MERSTQPICRACLRKCQSDNISLQDSLPMDTDEPTVSYAAAYTSCTQLEVQFGLDELPEWLCDSCAGDIQCAYAFRRRARKSFEKLCQILQLDKRAAPSEFALPDNNGADLLVACSVRGEHFARDPLDNFESDNELKPSLDTLYSGTQSPVNPTAAELMTDSDDDKPLKQLTSLLPLQSDQNMPNFKALPDYDFLYNNDDDDDDFIVDDTVTDAMFSPEAQIFLKGRYKCIICEHRYFTSIGLTAHMEVQKSKKKQTSLNMKSKKSIKAETEIEDVLIPDSQTSNTSNQHLPSDTEKITFEENVDNKVAEQVPQTNKSKARKTKEPKPPKRMLPCKVCGKEFISASKLRYHMVMHTGERNYLCTMCPNSYTTIYGLRHHIRSHTGERPYECKFCGDRFLRTTTLKSHQRRHTGERPYGCDVCGKRFIQHSSMATHMRLNHMDKTIQCPHCIKKYARQIDLNAHLLSHTGYKPFRCQLCPSRFVRQSNLNKHMNQQHTSKEVVVENLAENGDTNPAGSGAAFVDNSFN